MFRILGIITVVCVLFLLISFFSSIAGAVMVRKESEKDDKLPEVRRNGRILEKSDDVYNPGSVGIKVTMPMERIVFEDDQGNRIRLRNIKGKDILLAVGDTGVITYRGDTIYAFERGK